VKTSATRVPSGEDAPALHAQADASTDAASTVFDGWQGHVKDAGAFEIPSSRSMKMAAHKD
jgi:hypothetical protein